MSELHTSIVALVSLAAGIASKHPDMGLCQLEKLRALGIREEQIAAVVEIARHIRDEAAQKLDVLFDEKASHIEPVELTPDPTPVESCCSTTPGGRACC